MNSWNNKKINFILIFFLIFNLLLKSWYSSNSSLWSDEAASIAYSLPNYSELFSIAFQTAVPPGYYIILHIWMNIFGDSEFFVRFISVLFSSLSAVLIFTFAKKFLNLQTALLASVFFLLSNISIYYAQEARPYALAELLVISSFYLFFELLRKPTGKLVFFLGIVNFMMIFTHYLTVLVFAVQFIAVMFLSAAPSLAPLTPQMGGNAPTPPFGGRGAGGGQARIYIKSYFISLLIAFALFSPWLQFVLKNFTLAAKTWLTPPTFSQFKWVFIEFAGDKALAFMFIGLAVFSAGYLMYEYFSSLQKEKNSFHAEGTKVAQRVQSRVLGIANFAGKKINLIYLTILLLWAVLPVILAYIISQFNPVFYPRYFLYSSVGLYLFLAYLFSAVNLKPIYKALVFAPIVIYSIFILDLSPSKGEDWKNAVPEIIKEKETITPPSGGQGGAAIIISVWYQYRPFTYYYNRGYFRDYNKTIEHLKNDNVFCTDKAEGLKETDLSRFNKIILVQSHQPVADLENTVLTYFSKNFLLQKSKEYAGIKVKVFGKRK